MQEIAFFLLAILFSVALPVLHKLMYSFYGQGVSSLPLHKFSKPWFQTFVTYLGMFISIKVYDIGRSIHKLKIEDEVVDTTLSKNSAEEKNKRWIYYCITAAPGTSKMLSDALSLVCLLHFDASIWCSLQGMSTILIVMYNYIVGIKPLRSSLIGVIITSIATISYIVYFALVETSSLPFIFVLLCSQILKLLSYSFENYYFRDVIVSSDFVNGMEGFWGFFILYVLVFPIIHNIPATEDDFGLHEDIWDALVMLSNNLLWIIPEVFILIISIPNSMAKGAITFYKQSSNLTVIESLSSIFVWIIQSILYYATNNESDSPSHVKIGEKIDWLAFPKLILMLLMIVGNVMSSGIFALATKKDNEIVSP